MTKLPKPKTKRTAKAPKEPAPAVTRTPELRQLEEDARGLYFALKKLNAEGPEGAIDALKTLQRCGYDPYSASITVTERLHGIDSKIDHAKAMAGRKVGAREPETEYIEALINHLSHEDTNGLWMALRVILDDLNNKKNPTPGKCPFNKRYDGIKLVVLKRSKPYEYRTFANRVSEIRRRER